MSLLGRNHFLVAPAGPLQAGRSSIGAGVAVRRRRGAAANYQLINVKSVTSDRVLHVLNGCYMTPPAPSRPAQVIWCDRGRAGLAMSRVGRAARVSGPPPGGARRGGGGSVTPLGELG